MPTHHRTDAANAAEEEQAESRLETESEQGLVTTGVHPDDHALADLLLAEAGASLETSDDSELIGRARTDPEAFGLLYQRYVDRIYSYVYHRVGNAQDAEDLTARTFHRALGSLHSYQDRGLPFAAWLFRIAHNLVANWHRDRSRRRLLSLDRIWSHRSAGDDPEDALEKKETHDALWSAINRLPADRRDLLLYKFSSRMSNLEIGKLMHKSESAVKSLYFRTLASLRKELEERGWGADGESLSLGVAAFGSDGDDADGVDDE
jgi:RNA polymerase sigma-70 factor, ECF subfamily